MAWAGQPSLTQLCTPPPPPPPLGPAAAAAPRDGALGGGDGGRPDRARPGALALLPGAQLRIRAGKSPAHTPGQVSGLLWVPWRRDVSRAQRLEFSPVI